jgi:hypothetical protein
MVSGTRTRCSCEPVGFTALLDCAWGNSWRLVVRLGEFVLALLGLCRHLVLGILLKLHIQMAAFGDGGN